MDNDIVVTKTYRKTRQKLNVASALAGKTGLDFLDELIEGAYKKLIEKAHEKSN